ncbi:Inner membrane protein YtfF [compost metagenome]
MLGSWLANLLWNAASRRLPLTLTGQLIVFETLFSLLYGFLYLQRLPTLLETLAIGLLIGGVTWAVRRHAVPHGEMAGGAG